MHAIGVLIGQGLTQRMLVGDIFKPVHAVQAPANGARQVLIQAQASLRTISGLVHSASGTIFSQ